MKRIHLIFFCVLCAMAIPASAAERPDGPASASPDRDVPNVVLIYIDDLGYGDIGCYGCKDIPTPNIDQLAAEGVRCTASYITNPPCCPSRCGLMMGQYAQRFGKYGMSRGLPIPEDRPTMARLLSDNGYVTGQIGKWDLGSKRQGPLQVGFNEVAKTPPKKKYTKKEIAALPEDVRKVIAKKPSSKYFCINETGETMWLTDYDGDSMTDFVKRHKDEPFFLYWSPAAVHSPSNEAPERLMARTTAKGKRRKLAGAIVSVDDQVGKLMSALKKHGLRENTLVIFTSDNGANGGEGGSSAPYVGGKGQGTQKEGWVRVPTIFSMLGTLPEGKQHDGLIANFDFYSTIAALSGQPIPEHCDGVDLFPYLKGERTGDAHEYLFWLNNEPGDAVRRHLIAVRWKDWRLYKKYEKDPWQLFDLKTDPREETDLAAKHPGVVKQMAAKHAAWATTLAPLGKIPEIEAGAPTLPTGHGWATAGKEPIKDLVKPEKLEIRHSMLGYRDTLVFYSFKEQAAILVMSINNQDETFPVTGKVHLFDKTTTEEELKKWINNQHSDGLFADIPQPISTKDLPKGFCKVTSSKQTGTSKNPGPRPGTYKDFEVTYSIKSQDIGNGVKFPAVTDTARVHVQSK